MDLDSLEKVEKRWFLISSYFQKLAINKKPLETSDYMELSEKFNLSRRRIEQIIKDYNNQILKDASWPSVAPKYHKEKAHLKEIISEKLDVIIACIKEHNYKITVQDISIVTGIPKSTVGRIMKKNGIISRYSYARPMLTSIKKR